jgi:beta-aspartyl-dipeptidase (metallo-type)
MSGLLYTGGISHPPKSLTGDVFRDLLLIEEVIGLKTSVAEDLAGRVDFETLLRLSGLARCGGEMGGKTGVLHVHLGGIVAEMDVLFRLIEEQREYRHIVVTHVNMSEAVLARSREFASRGGHIDFTAVQNPALNRHGSVKASRAIAKALEAGVQPDLISISSDSVGVVTPPENERAARSHFGPEILLNELRDLVLEEGFPLARALPFVTTNPARLLGLDPRGRIVVGGDADVAVFDRRLRTRHLIARGTLVYGCPASRT